MVQIDSRGIQWSLATGEQTVISQSRFDSGDFRWSRNYENALCGFEVVGIGTFSGTNSSAHFALKHNGPNHSSPCGYEESGECCCWMDTGIRYDGAVQLQTERPHPSNHDFSLGTANPAGPLYLSNIGQAMDGHTIGLRWIWYPLIQNGNSDNGGTRYIMYSCINALSGGLPTNNWQIVYDFIDNSSRNILTDYDPPEEQEIEVRNSDTDDTTFYGGGIHARRLLPTDVYGGGQGCPAGTHFDTVTQQCVQDSTSCPAGQHWDWTLGQCVLDSTPPPPPPPTGPTKATDLKLYLSGGSTNENPILSLGGNISTKEFLGATAHEILDLVSLSEMQQGMTDYHMLYLKNTNALYSFNNIRMFVLQNTINPYDSILLGWAAGGKNYTEYPILTDTVVPPNVIFSAADTSTTGLGLPALGPNEKIGVWIKRILNQGSEPHPANIAKIAIDFSPASEPSDPNVPPPEEPSCPQGQHWDATQNDCVDDSIPPPPPDPQEVVFSVGVVSDMQCNSEWANIYSHLKSNNPVKILCAGDFLKDGTCMIDSVQDTRDKWIIAMGNHDTNESQPQPSTENAVRAFGRFPTENFYTTTFNNVAVVVFDSTQDTTATGAGSIPTGQSFKFNIGGDFRGGSDAEDTADNLISDTPAVIFMLGDYAVDEGSPEEWTTETMAVVAESNIPVWGVHGNHDEDEYLETGFFRNNLETGWVWQVKYGNIMFISCDTVTEDVAATRTLVEAAQANPAIMRIVILMHESMFKQEGGGTVGSDTVLDWHWVFKANPKVKLVIAGHSHHYTRFNPIDGITYIINEDGGQDPDATTGCMHCSSDNIGNITCNMVTNSGATIDTFTIPATPIGQSQATFMDTELKRLSSNSAIEWIFVVQHYPFYSTEGHHSNDVDQREYWHPKFDQYKVDAMFNGHNHCGEVTSLIRYNSANSDLPIVTQSGGTYSYFRGTPNHGMLFVQVPCGGDSVYGAGDIQNYHEFVNGSIDGYVMLDFSEEGRKCTIRVIDKNGNLLYVCSITHRV